MKTAGGILVFLMLFGMILGQEPKQKIGDATEISLDDILNTEVSVASKKATSLRDTPGIISVITREDMLSYGCRDLVDVLTLLVPGFGFGVDVEGVVGFGLRGIWGHEGKILLMVDGQEINEGLFGTTQFGNHFPVDNIQKIEIIRGPGSAIYGGYAGLGVVNIITRGSEMKGGYVSALVSRAESSYSHSLFSFGAGNEFKGGKYSITGVFGRGNRSDRDNVDYAGSAHPMKGYSELNIYNLNLDVAYKGFEVRFISDLYRTSQIDLWGENYSTRALPESFDTWLLEAKYTYKASEGLTLIPKYSLKIQKPWEVDIPDQEYTCHKEIRKWTAGLSAIWDITEAQNLVFGGEFFSDYIYLPDHVSAWEETFKTGDRSLGYKNFSAFGQYMVKTSFCNFTAGGRLDTSDEYGTSFVPRFGYTKAWENFHLKVMASQSFRMPGGILPNRIPPGSPLVSPEKATTYEVEAGYKLGKSLFLINGYNVQFNKVIVYTSDPVTGLGTYANQGKIGSRGIEAAYKYLGERCTFDANYSFYRVGKNTVESYSVPGEDGMFLAFPGHRINLMGGVKITPKISLHPSVSIFGKRYGFTSLDTATDTDILREFDTMALCNINLRFKDLCSKHLELDFGVRNIFDKDFDFLQPYKGSHAPLPSLQRAFVFHAICSF